MKKAMPYITPLLVLIIILAGSTYVGYKFSWSAGLDSAIIFSLGFFFYTILCYVGVFALINKRDKISHIFYLASAFSMGFILYFLLANILFDIVFQIIKFPPFYFNLLTIGFALGLCAYGYFHSKKIKIIEKKIKIKGLKKTIKAVHLTDIHIGRFRSNGEYLQEIIDKTNALNPEVIFFTGDYIDAGIALKDKHFEPLKYFKAPIYFIEGNHDVTVDAPEVLAKAKKYGAHTLENECVQWNDIQIIGLKHMVADSNTYSRHTTSKGSTIRDVLEEISPDKNQPSILLHHSPDGIKYASEHHIDLYLAGHTHGGQMFPVTFISDYFFSYNKGIHKYKNTSIFVSKGLGTAGPPMRIGSTAEIVVLYLVPEM